MTADAYAHCATLTRDQWAWKAAYAEKALEGAMAVGRMGLDAGTRTNSPFPKNAVAVGEDRLESPSYEVRLSAKRSQQTPLKPDAFQKVNGEGMRPPGRLIAGDQGLIGRLQIEIGRGDQLGTVHLPGAFAVSAAAGSPPP